MKRSTTKSDCPRCFREHELKAQLCWCGHNYQEPCKSKPTANEEYIFHNTKTSHKRYESMVLYALHYALQFVEIRSQFHVCSMGKDYYIDAYIPALNLAIEIDEPYHEGQVAHDIERQKAIESELGCKFIRVSCRESIYKQVDEIVEYIKEKNTNPWFYQRPNLNVRSGEYSKSHWNGLLNNNIPEEMDFFAEKLRSDGYEIKIEAIRGIPSTSNGEYGFLISKIGFTLAVYARKTGRVNVRLMEYPEEIEPFIAELTEARQVSKKGVPKYYAILSCKNSVNSISEAQEEIEHFFTKVELKVYQ